MSKTQMPTKRTVIFLLMLLMTVLPNYVYAEEDGLMAYWDFDEGLGNVLHDRSGNNNDGVIKGAEWTNGFRGKALKFNGVKGSIVEVDGSNLRISGDTTFMCWLKFGENGGRDHLVFGAADQVGINRSISIYIDKKGFFVAHANGSNNDLIAWPFSPQEQWVHLAIVFKFPWTYVYFDGELKIVQEMQFPITDIPSSYGIGGWFAGAFDGVIDEMRVYKRSLSESEIARISQNKKMNILPVCTILKKWQPRNNMLLLNLFCRNIPSEYNNVVVDILSPSKDNMVMSRTLPLKQTTDNDNVGRILVKAPIELSLLPAGEYFIRVSCLDAAGQKIKLVEEGMKYPGKPFWAEKKSEIPEKVLPPYIPVKLNKGESELKVSVLGREYMFGKSLFLDQVVTNNSPVLASPIRLNINGKESSQFNGHPIALGRHDDVKASFIKKIDGENFKITSTSEIEYDGFVKINWKITAVSSVTIRNMSIEVPVDAKYATLFYTWPTGGASLWGSKFEGYSGLCPEKFDTDFKPILWMGNEQGGISFLQESDKNWHISNLKDGVQIRKNDKDKIVVLKLNIVNKPVMLKSGEDIEYTFAILATPVKPIEKDGWDYAIINTPRYGHPYDITNQKIEGLSAAQYLKEAGYDICLLDNWTDIMAYPWPIGKEKEFKELVKLCHAEGLRIEPYLGYQINDAVPEYQYIDECVVKPLFRNPDIYPGMEKSQMQNTVCLNSAWQDCLVDNVSKMIDEFDIDGIYLDSTNMPFPCQNEAHGCGYRDGKGQLHCTYPVFAVRETFKRFYSVIKNKKPDGFIDSHVFDCMNPATLPFVTIYWNGEQLLRKGDNIANQLPLDKFRTEMMGSNWGVPADFLGYSLGDYKDVHSISLLHDIRVRECEISRKEVLVREVLKLGKKFGRKEAKFIPYWDSSISQYLTVSPEGCYASLYLHKQNGALIIASNLSGKNVKPKIVINSGNLGLHSQTLIAKDALTDKEIEITDGIIELEEFPNMGWMYIWIK